MPKKPTVPIKVTAYLEDGRINSADGIIMLDAILYHAWFYRYAPHVLEGLGGDSVPGAGHIGLPLRQDNGNRYFASRAVYEQESVDVEHWNKRPNFFSADASRHLDKQVGLISTSAGMYRAYRMPQVIRHIKDGRLTFYAVGNADKVIELLDNIPAVGKKAAMGWGIVRKWEVAECPDDYSTMHPEHGLMRPMPVEEMPDLKGYPIMKYAIRPPYWKQCNMRLCYVPIMEAKNDI